jgi:hypothetical protein
MEAIETARIIEFLSFTDNRKITEDGIKAWHGLIGHLDFDVARTAAHMAKQDDKIDWVEPKHIIAKARIVASHKDSDVRRERAVEEKPKAPSSPMPTCKHGKGLLHCDPCCLAIYEQTKAR